MTMNNSQRCSRKDMHGFSLLELTIVMTILVATVGILAGIVGSVQTSYARLRPRAEAINNANAAMDTLVRMIRMSGNNLSGSGITPDPDGNGSYDSIKILADWAPVGGGTGGVYENITFSIGNGTNCNNCVLKKQEPADGAAVDFVEGIGSLTFTYYDNNNALISNPVLNDSQIALVKMILITSTPGSTPQTFTSTAHLRKR